MTKKILYIDVETTGLIKYVHGIIQLAYIIEIDGQVKKRGQFKIDPRTYKKDIKITEAALRVNGHTPEQFNHYQDSREACVEFVAILQQFVDRNTWDDQFKFIGFNGGFDVGFVQEWFRDSGFTKNFGGGTEEYAKLINYKDIDPFALIKYLNFYGVIDIGPKENLVACCKELLDLELDAHDAAADIEATRDLHLHLVELIKG